MSSDTECQDVTANQLITIPQADNIDKIRSIPELLNKGFDTPSKFGKINNMTTRQGSYYLEAARALGLVEKKNGSYTLTSIGMEIAGVDKQKQNQILVKCILGLPIIDEIIRLAEVRGLEGVSRDDIISLVAQRTGYKKTTLVRRSTTLLSYLDWVSKKNKIIIIRYNKVYYNNQVKSTNIHKLS